MSRGPIPDRPADRPTVPEVVALANQIYTSPGGGAGCCLHIVLDDDNLGDNDMQYCIGHARDRGHELCERVALMMLQMTTSQRRRVSRSHD